MPDWTARRREREVLALVIAWSREQPDRVGEVALVDGPQVLGRGSARAEDGAPRVRFLRQRPGIVTVMGPIENLRVSRAQLRLVPQGDSLQIESIGRCPLLVNGERVERAAMVPGDTVQLEGELVFLVERRSERMLELTSSRVAGEMPFGAADRFGFVGETPAAWAMRDRIAFAARASGHVLISGDSGTGKELCAAAIHGLSVRAARTIVARNAATFPTELIDAELFGNAKNYPNPGTPEREGVIGEADGATLFLDEIGELPLGLQAHLLRVLDRGGEYQRLGEARARRADLRVVAATNRAVTALKHDLAARFTLRVEVPSLADRRGDVPLLIRHLLVQAATGSDEIRRRFCATAAGGVEPRVAPALVERLLRYSFRTNTRELAQLLWQALAESRGDTVELTDGVANALAEVARPAAAASELGRAEIEAALAAADGSVTRAARTLGLKNRFVLYRLMKKLGIESASEDEPEITA